jgi:hypothetical protein
VLPVLFVENDGVLPAWTQINDAVGVGRVEFGEFFGEGLDGREHELEGDLDDRSCDWLGG